jgi:hypothetical protein
VLRFEGRNMLCYGTCGHILYIERVSLPQVLGFEISLAWLSCNSNGWTWRLTIEQIKFLGH